MQPIGFVCSENPKGPIETIGITKKSAQGQNRVESLHVSNNKKVESSSNKTGKHRITILINTNTMDKGKP